MGPVEGPLSPHKPAADRSGHFQYDFWAMEIGRFNGVEDILAASAPNAGEMAGAVSS